MTGKPSVELTLTARNQAERRGMLSAVLAFQPPQNLVKGDVVRFEAEEGPVSFLVRQRRFIVGGDGRSFVQVQLDYPVR